MDGIPNIGIQNIGTVRKPLQVIKGFIELPCWTGYFLTEKPNFLIKNKVVTHGRIDLWVDGEIRRDGSFTIDPEQTNAYIFLVKQQEQIKQSILQELKNKFPQLLLDEYASWDQEDASLPRIADLTPAFDFKNFIGPASISIEEEVKDETAYIKWHFQCRWDPEHGFEVITHKDRVIDIAAEADIFKIHKDNGSYDALENELKKKVWKVPGQRNGGSFGKFAKQWKPFLDISIYAL